MIEHFDNFREDGCRIQSCGGSLSEGLICHRCGVFHIVIMNKAGGGTFHVLNKLAMIINPEIIAM